MSVHEQRVGRWSIAARRGIAAAADAAAVPVMWMMWTGQVDEARGGSRSGGWSRLTAECQSRGEAARTTQQAVRMA